MDILDFGTPFGLAFASGLNAYLPMLAFSLAVRWLKLYKVNQHFAFVTQGWFIVVLVILTLLDFVADKIPVLDHIWNAIHTFVRPIAGAVVAIVASSHALPPVTTGDYIRPDAALVTFSAIPIAGVGLFVIFIVGAALAFLSHTTKLTARLFSTITTAGFFNTILSFVEDGLVLIIILLSLFASAIMLILLVLLLFFLIPRFMRARNSWIRRV
jgi:hypothetical protein